RAARPCGRPRPPPTALSSARPSGRRGPPGAPRTGRARRPARTHRRPSARSARPPACVRSRFPWQHGALQTACCQYVAASRVKFARSRRRMPRGLEAHALAVLGLTVLASVLFASEKLAIETTCLLVLALLAVAFQVFPYERHGEAVEPTRSFSGFGDEALVASVSLMVLGRVLVVTGEVAP